MKARNGNLIPLSIGVLVVLATSFALMAHENSTKADTSAALGVGVVLGLVCAAMAKVLVISRRQPRAPSDSGYGMGDEGPFFDFDGSPVGARNSD